MLETDVEGALVLGRGLVMAALLFVGSVYFVFHDGLPFQNKRLVIPSSAGSLDQQVNAPSQARGKVKSVRVQTKESKATVALPISEQLPVTFYEVVVPIARTPTSADVHPGMTRAELTTKFGSPALSATWNDIGHLHEKLIYEGFSQITSILIQDGRVVYSHTEPYAVSVEPEEFSPGPGE